MSLQHAGAAQDAGTVHVRVQVIDVEPVALDLVVPTYIPAKDLTQRIARDANLGAFWADGKRRQFWLRARGRVLLDHEKLQDLGIVQGELLHLLPQPPEGSGVIERPPEYPETHGYSAAGTLNIIGSLFMVLLWTAGWASALTYSQNPLLGLLPAVGIALQCTSFASYLWGGKGADIKVPITAVVVTIPLLVMALLPAMVLAGVPAVNLILVGVLAMVGALLGVTMGWLAWFGAVEPLPKVSKASQVGQAAAQQVPCGVCGGAVDVNDTSVRADCVYGCGRVFHVGCYKARQAVAADNSRCAICGYSPQGA